jgi:hypothetical protein
MRLNIFKNYNCFKNPVCASESSTLRMVSEPVVNKGVKTTLDACLENKY